jgi:hypothetical protein
MKYNVKLKSSVEKVYFLTCSLKFKDVLIKKLNIVVLVFEKGTSESSSHLYFLCLITKSKINQLFKDVEDLSAEQLKKEEDVIRCLRFIQKNKVGIC